MHRRYLTTITKEEALARALARIQPLTGEERVPVQSSSGRILSRPVVAEVSNPPFTCSAMDGYAVAFEMTLEADTVHAVTLRKPEDAVRVNTGDPLPQGANAVIMVEEVEERNGEIIIRKPVYLWQHVRMVGEDVVEGDLLLPPNHTLRLLETGMLLSAGIRDVWVRTRPVMLIVPTGKELFDIIGQPGSTPGPGMLIDFNSPTLSALAEEMGFRVVLAQIARDKHDLKDIIESNYENCDVMVINAGSSAGTEDFTEQIVQELGELVFHGVSMMPGKPVLFGVIKGKPLFGIPGYPVSAAISFMTFLQAAYQKMTATSFNRRMVQAVTAYAVPSSLGVEEIVRVNLVPAGGRYHAFVLPRGASLFSSLAKADGLLTIPTNIEGYGEGEHVRCELLREEHEIGGRICIAGSHDLCLDILRSLAKTREPGTDLLSLSVGSLGGLMALGRGIVDLCTSHILDEKKKVYNIPAVERYLAGKAVTVVHIAKRIQGFLLAPGNPKGVRELEDIAGGGVTFVNRQSGSGTRILLDSMLSERGMNKTLIRGYEREEATHTAVGILVKQGVVDAGLAIYPVSRLFSLDFLPLAEEEYDLVVNGEYTKTEKFHFLMDLLNSAEFKDRLSELGGYSTAQTGTIKYVTG